MDCGGSQEESSSASDDDGGLDCADYYCVNEINGESYDLEACEKNEDPEYIEYSSLDVCQVERLLNETVARVADALAITPALAKMLLHANSWDEASIIRDYRTDRLKLLCESHVIAVTPVREKMLSCAVCTRMRNDCVELRQLKCGHQFCIGCWQTYCETQISNGVSTRIGCMWPGCSVICPEDFVLQVLSDRADLRAKYEQLVFKDFVASHPQLRICSGRDCPMVIKAKTQKAKKVTCARCNTSFCIRCGNDYHAPTSCETIRMWLVKCADDSETANYISAHTKDCPNCHSCIEKNGGCNHMQCAKCKHHFCWMCFGDWKTHGSEYYECSRYKENPSVAQEANHVKARRALEKYLHYYERYENHNKSLKLEEELQKSIMRKIEEKVNGHEGTWIDWQHLHRAAMLLTKCRYTLQYTYPYAYYMENGPRKELFEYQQAQLEKEIEELSWKVERAESTERGDLESQMHVAERKRRTLLEDFFD